MLVAAGNVPGAHSLQLASCAASVSRKLAHATHVAVPLRMKWPLAQALQLLAPPLENCPWWHSSQVAAVALAKRPAAHAMQLVWIALGTRPAGQGMAPQLAAPTAGMAKPTGQAWQPTW